MMEYHTNLELINTYTLYGWGDTTRDHGTNVMVAHPFKDELYGCGYDYYQRGVLNNFKRAVWWKMDTNRNFVE